MKAPEWLPLDGHSEDLDEIRIWKDDPIRGVVEWGAMHRLILWLRKRAQSTDPSP